MVPLVILCDDEYSYSSHPGTHIENVYLKCPNIFFIVMSAGIMEEKEPYVGCFLLC